MDGIPIKFTGEEHKTHYIKTGSDLDNLLISKMVGKKELYFSFNGKYGCHITKENMVKALELNKQKESE